LCDVVEFQWQKQLRLGCAVDEVWCDVNTARCGTHPEGLPLVHLMAHPEPFLSLKPPDVHHETCLR